MQSAQVKAVEAATKAAEQVIVQKVTSTIALKAASMFATVALGALGGVIAGALLMGIASLFMPPNLTPDEIYDKIWGKIQSQIGSSIAAHSTAESQSQIGTLMQNIATIVGTLNTSPVPASIVDQLLSVHNSLMSNTVWYQLPGSVDNFVLCGPVNGEKTECLHTGQVRDWAFARVDGEANLDSLNDMTWSVDQSDELMMSQPGQKFCLDHDGNGRSRNYIAIWNQQDDRCKRRAFKLLKNADNTWSIKEGNTDICVFTGGKDGRVLVNRNERGGDCANGGDLRFRYKITIPSNKAGSGGVTGDSTTATQSFGQIGIQMYYFPQLATAHLVALKELHIRSPGDGTYGTLFEQKVKEYKAWIDYYGPIFSSYSDLKGFDPKTTMDRVMEFRQQLDKATLNADQITLNIPKSTMSKFAVSSKRVVTDDENEDGVSAPQRRRNQAQSILDQGIESQESASISEDTLPAHAPETRKKHKQAIFEEVDDVEPSEASKITESEVDEPVPVQKKLKKIITQPENDVDDMHGSQSQTKKSKTAVEEMEDEETFDPSEFTEAIEEEGPAPVQKEHKDSQDVRVSRPSTKVVEDVEEDVAEDMTEETGTSTRHRKGSNAIVEEVSSGEADLLDETDMIDEDSLSGI